MAETEGKSRGNRAKDGRSGVPVSAAERSSADGTATSNEASGVLNHRLRGAAFDADFDDAESDSSAVSDRRNEKISES